jgi:hypothetical protein
MESSQPTRHFRPPWTLIRENSECYTVPDANGVTVAWLFCRDDSQRYKFRRRQAHIGRSAPDRKGHQPHSGIHVAASGFLPARRRATLVRRSPLSRLRICTFASTGVRSTGCARSNRLPFNATGEVIQNDGVWRVYEFTWQMDAILFWDRFQGRWLRGTEFHYPERPANLPSLKPLPNWPKFNPRDTR